MVRNRTLLYDKTPLDNSNCKGEYDYIVIGSGAGGGPVAANLARAGFRVALLEAGGSDTPDSYEVPAFHVKATEDAGLGWNYFVRHYKNEDQQHRDSKKVLVGDEPYVWYPRSGTLGGCTAHHALVTIFPHDSDWDHIAYVTGDKTWHANNMKRYLTQIERCGYAWKSPFGRPHPGGHGFTGWLSTSIARPKLLTSDWKLLRIVLATLLEIIKGRVWSSLRYVWSAQRDFQGSFLRFAYTFFDPNDARHPAFKREGLFYMPFSTERGRRVSVRDFLHVTQQDCPNNLMVFTHTLATRVLFDKSSLRPSNGPLNAIGVEVLEGLHLYRADSVYLKPQPNPGTRRPTRYSKESLYSPDAQVPKVGWLRATREVILAGGAFNSPQLLMLSGIGAKKELAVHRIKALRDRPGVGKNLQDRYEVGVVCKTRTEFKIARGATFRRPAMGEVPDPQFKKWLRGRGPYTTNGAVIGFSRKSDERLEEPDLIFFCVPGIFRGYFPGYSKESFEKAHFSWLILKAHTKYQGTVTLRSEDPRVPPEVCFGYFNEGSTEEDATADLEAMVDGIEFVRRLNARVSDIIAHEWVPGPDKADREALRKFVRDEAWGHHASCSSKMGASDDPTAVVDSNFNVIGTRRLRVVDASVFPRIPGFFIVTPIYMIAQKASEVIVEDAHSGKILAQPNKALPNPPPRLRAKRLSGARRARATTSQH